MSIPAFSSRIRVLIVGPSMDILGGQAVQAKRLLDDLAGSQVVDARFLAINPRLPGPFRALQKIKYVRTVVTSIAFIATLVRAVPRADVVHVFSASYYSYLLSALPALVVGRAFGRGTILNYRSGEAEDHLAKWPVSRRSGAAFSSLVVVPSGYLIQVFAQFGINAESIANIVPIESLPYRARRTFRPRILSNRNLEPMYNIACTIRAFAHVQHVHPDAELIIVGGGSQRGTLESLVRDLRLHNVSFIGHVPNAAMGEWYDRCDIYVNSSDIDNMPTSIIEAFACGLAVATTDAGGIPFVVADGHTGLMVPRNDDRALGGALLRYLDDQEFARRVTLAGRQECEARYVWREVQSEWESRYARLAGKAGIS